MRKVFTHHRTLAILAIVIGLLAAACSNSETSAAPIVGNVMSADPATDAATVPAFDIPGGNSLNIPTQTPTATFDGPGGNSLNIPTNNQTTTQTPAFDSPGGNSLNIP